MTPTVSLFSVRVPSVQGPKSKAFSMGEKGGGVLLIKGENGFDEIHLKVVNVYC